MKELFKALAKAEQAHNLTADLQGRSLGLSLAVVANVDDPMQLARIQVMLPSKGAKTLSDWLVRLTPSKLVSVPLVDVGDLVVVGFINGDPSNGVYLGAINNIPQPPAKDLSSNVSLNSQTAILQTADDVTIVAGESTMKLTKDGGLEISGITSFTVNGKQVATIGATDTRGDSLITKGWS